MVLRTGFDSQNVWLVPNFYTKPTSSGKQILRAKSDVRDQVCLPRLVPHTAIYKNVMNVNEWNEELKLKELKVHSIGWAQTDLLLLLEVYDYKWRFDKYALRAIWGQESLVTLLSLVQAIAQEEEGRMVTVGFGKSLCLLCGYIQNAWQITLDKSYMIVVYQ